MSPSQPHSCWLKINFLIVSREFTIQKPTKAKRLRRKFSRKSLQAVKKQIKNSFTDHESDELHRSWKCLSLSRDYQHENLSCDDKKSDSHRSARRESHRQRWGALMRDRERPYIVASLWKSKSLMTENSFISFALFKLISLLSALVTQTFNIIKILSLALFP